MFEGLRRQHSALHYAAQQAVRVQALFVETLEGVRASTGECFAGSCMASGAPGVVRHLWVCVGHVLLLLAHAEYQNVPPTC